MQVRRDRRMVLPPDIPCLRPLLQDINVLLIRHLRFLSVFNSLGLGAGRFKESKSKRKVLRLLSTDTSVLQKKRRGDSWLPVTSLEPGYNCDVGDRLGK